VPDGFHYIRHIGFVEQPSHRQAGALPCPAGRAANTRQPSTLHRWQDCLRELAGIMVEVCPGYGGQMLPCGTLPSRLPP
jgi:hypothetical protein